MHPPNRANLKPIRSRAPLVRPYTRGSMSLCYSLAMRRHTSLGAAITTAVAAATFALGAPGLAQSGAQKPLQIYVVDVEGGNAVLYVAPSGESVLIDTGNAGAAAVRDAERIAAAAKDAGVTQIDHLITTHWHGDHFGGMEELVKRLPITQFIDHGPNEQPANPQQPQAPDFSRTTYPTLYATGNHWWRSPVTRFAVVGARLADRHVERGRAQDAACRSGQAQPGVRRRSAARSRPERERALGRQRHHVRQVPRRAARRSHMEQGTRADVPEQSPGHSRPLHHLAPRPDDLEFAGARPRPAAARHRHEQRHPQGRTAANDEDGVFVAGPRGSAGSCTSRSSAGRNTPRPGCSSPTGSTRSRWRFRLRR